MAEGTYNVGLSRSSFHATKVWAQSELYPVDEDSGTVTELHECWRRNRWGERGYRAEVVTRRVGSDQLVRPTGGMRGRWRLRRSVADASPRRVVDGMSVDEALFKLQ